MIVFLIANKISSFGVRDEAGGRGEKSEEETDRPGRLVPEKRSRLPCRGSAKRDNVSVSAVTLGQMGSSLSQSFFPQKHSAGALRQPSHHTRLTRPISNEDEVSPLCDNNQVH